MRYVRVLVEDRPRFGRIEEGAQATIALLDRDFLDGGAPTGEVVPLAGARLLAPCRPGKLVGVGLNYRAHAREMGKPLPEEPLLFMKPGSAVLDPGAPIARPLPFARVDYEGELAVVIGRRAKRLSPTEALSAVFGYTICNDVTVRDLQRKDVQFTRAKGFDSFSPLGPAIATGLDPRALAVRTWKNGALVQVGTTEDMVFPVAEVVAFVSGVMTLEPGDVITTGTPPGVSDLQPGDVIAIEIAGIGRLENPVIADDCAGMWRPAIG